jgi:hypothetical protein
VLLRVALATLLLAILSVAGYAAPKTDVVVLINGDSITGEIKELKHGKLKYKTDSASTLYIKWAEIVSVKSDQQLQLEMSNGVRYFGSLKASNDSTMVQVVQEGLVIGLYKPQIVYIVPIKRGNFWSRLDGSISVGFSYTKVSQVAQLSFGADAFYRTRDHITTAELSSLTTRNADDEVLVRNNLGLSRRNLLRNRWWWGALGALESNDELGLDLRIAATPLVGRSIVHTNHTDWVLGLGLSLNEEFKNNWTTSTTNLELVISTALRVFQYRDPEMDLLTNLNVFPNLTNWGRVRAEFNINLRRELISDFFLDLNGYYSFDSDLGAKTSDSTNDYGVTAGLGWSF